MSNSIVFSMKKIEGLINDASISLSASLKYYWPAINPDNNAIQEANITFHFSIACSNYLGKNLFIYPEAAFKKKDGGDNRIDLMIYDNAENSILLVECKRLFSSEKADSILKDIKKISDFKVVDSNWNEGMNICKSTKKMGLILALTQLSDVKNWWNNMNGDNPKQINMSDSYSDSGWENLKEKLEDMKANVSEFEIGCQKVDSHFESWDSLYILYAIFEVPDKQ